MDEQIATMPSEKDGEWQVALRLVGATWVPDDQDGRRLASSVALAKFALSDPRLHAEHRRRLLDEAIWFYTERGSPSRKYALRYRTAGALVVQARLTATAAKKHLNHEHVQPRQSLIAALLLPGADVHAILSGATACVVTRDEHAMLKTHPAAIGWDRYQQAGLVVVDLDRGIEVDLEASSPRVPGPPLGGTEA